MSIGYAHGADLLDALVAARVAHDGDAFTDLFTEDAEVRLEPFAEPLVGHNALRAYLNGAAEAETAYELTIERHWVAGDAVLAAWHAAWTPAGTRERSRVAGFLVAEVRDGRIARLRQWWNVRGAAAG